MDQTSGQDERKLTVTLQNSSVGADTYIQSSCVATLHACRIERNVPSSACTPRASFNCLAVLGACKYASWSMELHHAAATPNHQTHAVHPQCFHTFSIKVGGLTLKIFGSKSLPTASPSKSFPFCSDAVISSHVKLGQSKQAM